MPKYYVICLYNTVDKFARELMFISVYDDYSEAIKVYDKMRVKSSEELCMYAQYDEDGFDTELIKSKYKNLDR